jgi:hypothetical protein
MVKYLNLVIISLLFVILYLIYTRQASFMDVVQEAMKAASQDAVKTGCVTVPGDCPPGSMVVGAMCQRKGFFGKMVPRPMVTKCS